MALYLDAAKVLEGASGEGSLKSRIYAPDSDFRSRAALFALIKEAEQRCAFLAEVIDNAGILQHEPKVSPLLAVLLVHDLFFAKGGIAASSGHPLRLAIERHKARLQAEFTRARLRRKCPTVQALKEALDTEKAATMVASNHVRWVRINEVKTTMKEQLESTFSGYHAVEDIFEVARSPASTEVLKLDGHVPSLLALPPELDLTKTRAFVNGHLILQDKASCFPAELLLGGSAVVEDILDACAAPGNKTTHLSALSDNSPRTIYACERNVARSETLKGMVKRAGASNVTVLAKQDFLALDPNDHRFSNVTHLLLDPSCSGSGILHREDVPVLVLPRDLRAAKTPSVVVPEGAKKRKRQQPPAATDEQNGAQDGREYEPIPMTASDERLEKLSNLQAKIVRHAFKFASAIRVSYSTCSVHVQENEAVVARALLDNDWRLLRRDEQVEGMKLWPHRGVRKASTVASQPMSTIGRVDKEALSDEDLEACIRCYPGDEKCTMGFFTCCFIKKDSSEGSSRPSGADDWEGFSDRT